MTTEPKKAPIPRGPRKQKPKKAISKPVCSAWARKTPEQIAEWKANIARGLEGKRGRPKGLPDGIGLKAWNIHKAKVEAETKLIMRKLVKDNELNSQDDAYAIEALETAVNIMRLQGDARNKLGAAKLILEYTKAKPSTKSEVTLNTAESFLESVLAEEKASEE